MSGEPLEIKDVAEPYHSMLEELREFGGAQNIDANLTSGVEQLIEESYQQMKQMERQPDERADAQKQERVSDRRPREATPESE